MSESNKRRKTKKLIEQAMVHLLMEESFDHITTVKLAETANISRSSFYTHYKDKYDMIERYQEKFFEQLERIFTTYARDRHKAMVHVFDLLKEEPLLVSLLSENGTKEIQTFLRRKFQSMLSQDLQERYNSGYKELTPTEQEYRSVYLTNAFFGVCQMWLIRGTVESSEEMAFFLAKMLD